jgi:hypothetical protein
MLMDGDGMGERKTFCVVEFACKCTILDDVFFYFLGYFKKNFSRKKYLKETIFVKSSISQSFLILLSQCTIH